MIELLIVIIVLGILGSLLFGPVVGRLFLLITLAGVGARLFVLITWLRVCWLSRKASATPTAA